MNKKALSALFALVCTVLLFPFFLGAQKSDSVKEITKPYLGVYRCEKILVGDEDKISRFRYLEIELNEDGSFFLRGKERVGKRFEKKGSYTFDTKSGEFEVTALKNMPLKKIGGKYEKGKLTVTACLGQKMLVLVFSR